MNIDRGGWTEHAACAGHPHPEWWFPDHGMAADVAKAKAVCATCPVREQCLAAALERHEPYGVWGGLTTLERWRPARRLVGKHRLPPTPDPRCGQDRGYQAHKNRGEYACDPCAQAHQRVNIRYRERQVAS